MQHLIDDMAARGYRVQSQNGQFDGWFDSHKLGMRRRRVTVVFELREEPIGAPSHGDDVATCSRKSLFLGRCDLPAGHSGAHRYVA
jgi:hypothetical protein